MMVFMGVSQHAEFDFDVRFARGDAHMLHPENTPEFNLKVALSPPGVLLVRLMNPDFGHRPQNLRISSSMVPFLPRLAPMERGD